MLMLALKRALRCFRYRVARRKQTDEWSPAISMAIKSTCSLQVIPTVPCFIKTKNEDLRPRYESNMELKKTNLTNYLKVLRRCLLMWTRISGCCPLIMEIIKTDWEASWIKSWYFPKLTLMPWWRFSKREQGFAPNSKCPESLFYLITLSKGGRKLWSRMIYLRSLACSPSLLQALPTTLWLWPDSIDWPLLGGLLASASDCWGAIFAGLARGYIFILRCTPAYCSYFSFGFYGIPEVAVAGSHWSWTALHSSHDSALFAAMIVREVFKVVYLAVWAHRLQVLITWHRQTFCASSCHRLFASPRPLHHCPLISWTPRLWLATGFSGAGQTISRNQTFPETHTAVLLGIALVVSLASQPRKVRTVKEVKHGFEYIVNTFLVTSGALMKSTGNLNHYMVLFCSVYSGSASSSGTDEVRGVRLFSGLLQATPLFCSFSSFYSLFSKFTGIKYPKVWGKCRSSLKSTPSYYAFIIYSLMTIGSLSEILRLSHFGQDKGQLRRLSCD